MKKNSDSSFIQFVKNAFGSSWGKLTTLVLVISSLIGIGVAIGNYKSEIDCKLGKMKLIEDYQTKLATQREACASLKVQKIENEVKSLSKVVDYLKKASDEN